MRGGGRAFTRKTWCLCQKCEKAYRFVRSGKIVLLFTEPGSRKTHYTVTDLCPECSRDLGRAMAKCLEGLKQRMDSWHRRMQGSV